MNLIKFLLFAVILIFQTACSDQSREDLWKKDISFLKTELAKKHKNLFFKTTKSVFNAKLDSIQEIISNKTDEELYVALQEIVALMGDDHSYIYYPKLYESGVFPIHLDWFADGIYVVNTIPKYSKLLHKKLVAFNDIPINEVVEKLSKVSSHANDAVAKSHFLSFSQSKIILQYYGIINSDSLTISYLDNSLVQKITVNIIELKKDTKVTWTGLQIYNKVLCEKNRNKLFWFEYNDSTKILYAQYNKCISKELYEKLGRKKAAKRLPSFDKFLADLTKTLKTKEIDKFVFDMRYNPGGSSPQGTYLVKQIAKISSINQKGKLFVVVGRKTFSSAILNSLDFQNHTEAIFVGEPTGGKPNHYGEVKKFSLPNSGLIVNYSSKYFTHAKEDTDSFYPDYEIKTNFEDKKNGIDPVMEWILNYKN